MDSVNQFPVFLLCALAGIVNGVFHDVLAPVRRRAPFAAGVFCDAALFLLLAASDIALSVRFCFPSFRFYMILGNAFGLILYFKSVHRIVDFFEKLCYNSFIKAKKGEKARKFRKMRGVNPRYDGR